jgi:hypothetical protein
MKFFPNHPATLEARLDDGGFEMLIGREFSWREFPGGNFTHVLDCDLGGQDMKTFFIREVDDRTAGYLQAQTINGAHITIRPYSTYDPVRAGLTSIPWPKSVMEDTMMGEGPMSLFALVDDNGDVATMMLDSPSAAYVRFNGAWWLVPDIDAIGDYDLVGVDDIALEQYDPADQSDKSVKITSMAVKDEEDFRVQVRYSGEPEAAALQPLVTETITASLNIPTIASARDIPAAVEFAQSHPDFQWYVERRARALGLEESFPWND